MWSKHCSTPEHPLPDFIAQIYCLLFGRQIYRDMQWTTIIHQLELRSHSCFVFLINHRLRLYFSKDCRSSYHKCHWCLQGFLQRGHSWLQDKCKWGANASKCQFGQVTVSLPALTKEHGHGAYLTHPSHYRNFSSREALKPNTSVALMWTVPGK